jgi:hypothetical protein
MRGKEIDYLRLISKPNTQSLSLSLSLRWQSRGGAQQGGSCRGVKEKTRKKRRGAWCKREDDEDERFEREKC